MPFIDARGISAYYDVTGEGDPVVFLHGGFCSAEVMRPLAEALSGYAVYAPERPAHGRTADRPGPFHYDDGVADTLAVLDALGLESAHILGFSDGAIIGMLLALRRPARVRSLVHISGNLFAGDEVYVPEELRGATMPDEQSALVEEEYARLSPDGADHSAEVWPRIFAMWESEPTTDPAELAALDLPVLVMAADGDIIALEHTALIRRGVRGAQLAIVPGTTHMLVREKPVLVAAIVQQFLDAVPR